MPKTVKEIMDVHHDPTHKEWLLEADDAQLDEYISLTSGVDRLHQAARAEREKRHFKRISKRHFTVIWGFIIAIVTMVFAGIAAWPVIREWFQSAPPANKAASSPPPQSHLAPATPPTLWYDDIFGGHHWTEFCFLVDPNGTSDFAPAGFHNSCDDAETNQSNKNPAFMRP